MTYIASYICHRKYCWHSDSYNSAWGLRVAKERECCHDEDLSLRYLCFRHLLDLIRKFSEQFWALLLCFGRLPDTEFHSARLCHTSVGRNLTFQHVREPALCRKLPRNSHYEPVLSSLVPTRALIFAYTFILIWCCELVRTLSDIEQYVNASKAAKLCAMTSF